MVSGMSICNKTKPIVYTTKTLQSIHSSYRFSWIITKASLTLSSFLRYVYLVFVKLFSYILLYIISDQLLENHCLYQTHELLSTFIILMVQTNVIFLKNLEHTGKISRQIKLISDINLTHILIKFQHSKHMIWSWY